MSRSAAFVWSERFCIASACSSDPCGNNAFRKHVMRNTNNIVGGLKEKDQVQRLMPITDR